MTLYHWTLNVKKLKESGFRDRHSRHRDEMEGVWFTDQLVGEPESIRPGMRLVTVDIPEKETEPYEEINKGSGYRAFNIPADIVNRFGLRFPTVYIDRGTYKIQ